MPDGVLTIPFPDGRSLWHDPALPAAVAETGFGPLAIVGHCFDALRTSRDLDDIAEALAAAEEPAGIVAATLSLAGRWVLIHPRIAMTDAGGTLPLVHGDVDGRTVCAASSRLLQAAYGLWAPNPRLDHHLQLPSLA